MSLLLPCMVYPAKKKASYVGSFVNVNVCQALTTHGGWLFFVQKSFLRDLGRLKKRKLFKVCSVCLVWFIQDIPILTIKSQEPWKIWIYHECGWSMISGWWYTYPSEKYEFVSCDHDIPNLWKNNPNVPNHQPGVVWKWCTPHSNRFKMIKHPVHSYVP